VSPDRIAVPTNGKGPHPGRDPEPGAESEVAGGPASSDAPASTPPFTPTQLAVGFGILASIVVIVAGRLRQRGRASRRGPFGRG
jgi:hypothetical protein